MAATESMVWGPAICFNEPCHWFWCTIKAWETALEHYIHKITYTKGRGGPYEALLPLPPTYFKKLRKRGICWLPQSNLSSLSFKTLGRDCTTNTHHSSFNHYALLISVLLQLGPYHSLKKSKSKKLYIFDYEKNYQTKSIQIYSNSEKINENLHSRSYCGSGNLKNYEKLTN